MNHFLRGYNTMYGKHYYLYKHMIIRILNLFGYTILCCKAKIGGIVGQFYFNCLYVGHADFMFSIASVQYAQNDASTGSQLVQAPRLRWEAYYTLHRSNIL
jgi:hypothetical protein